MILIFSLQYIIKEIMALPTVVTPAILSFTATAVYNQEQEITTLQSQVASWQAQVSSNTTFVTSTQQRLLGIMQAVQAASISTTNQYLVDYTAAIGNLYSINATTGALTAPDPVVTYIIDTQKFPLTTEEYAWITRTTNLPPAYTGSFVPTQPAPPPEYRVAAVTKWVADTIGTLSQFNLQNAQLNNKITNVTMRLTNMQTAYSNQRSVYLNILSQFMNNSSQYNYLIAQL